MTTATAPAPPVAPAPRAAAPPGLRLLRHEPDPDDRDRGDGPGPTRPRPAPSPVPDLQPTAELRRRAHQVMGLVLEVLGGRRPLAHLVPHLEPSALRYVRAALGQRAARPPSRMTSLHVSRPCAGALEVTAVHRAGPRARALAARLEGPPGEPGRWRCVTLRLL